ncbi:hypothetical protein QZN08_13405 [Burkholderia multivorans]|nr:hypothetical protein [Burkholderia multivorans]
MRYQYMPREKELHFWIVEEGKLKHLVYQEVGIHEVEENVKEMRERLAEESRRQKKQ